MGLLMDNVLMLRRSVSMEADELSYELLASLLTSGYLLSYKRGLKMEIDVEDRKKYSLANAALLAEPVSRKFGNLHKVDILHPASPELMQAVVDAVDGVYELVQLGPAGSIELYYRNGNRRLGSNKFEFFRLNRRGFAFLWQVLAMDAGYGAHIRIT